MGLLTPSTQINSPANSAGWKPSAGRAYTLYLQPQVSLPDGATSGYEILLRVVASTGAIESPDATLTAVSHLAVAARVAWHGHLLDKEIAVARVVAAATGKSVAVNVAAELWHDTTRIDALARTAGTGVTLEITERAPLDIGVVAAAAERLHAAGYGIALDDFGAGYANGACLHALGHVDYVKVDQSFATDARGLHLLAPLCAVIHAGGALAVIEGIESDAAHAAAVAAGADYAQGFRYGRPAPIDQLVSLRNAG